MSDIEWAGLRDKATGVGVGVGHRLAKPLIQNGIQEEKHLGTQVRGGSCMWLMRQGEAYL